jgi:hypothetical protein
MTIQLERLERASIREQFKHYTTVVRAMASTLDGSLPRPLVKKIYFIRIQIKKYFKINLKCFLFKVT